MPTAPDVQTLEEDDITVLSEEEIALMTESPGAGPTSGVFAVVAGHVSRSGCVVAEIS